MIRLSVVVAVYNTEKYLARCLDSLIAQDIPSSEYEIIVINDGSPDQSGSVVQRYVSAYPQVSYFEQLNIGLFETRNKGIELAKGDYIYFVDSDDFVAVNVFGKILHFMEKEQLDVFGFGIVKTKASQIDSPEIALSRLNNVEIYDGPTYISNFDFAKESVWIVIKRSYLISRNITYHKGISFSDGLFTAETLFYAKRIAVIPDEIYAYFQHQDSILHKNSPGHYRELIKRYEATTREFTKFRSSIEELNTLPPQGLERIRSKEISYIFFMLIRAVKSDMSVKELDLMLTRLKKDGYYPIKGFLGRDYNGLVYKTLVTILNNPYLLYPSVMGYRILAKLLRVITK